MQNETRPLDKLIFPKTAIIFDASLDTTSSPDHPDVHLWDWHEKLTPQFTDGRDANE